MFAMLKMSIVLIIAIGLIVLTAGILYLISKYNKDE
jgi:hypothetical protein